mgnify:CR=1 FL=1
MIYNYLLKAEENFNQNCEMAALKQTLAWINSEFPRDNIKRIDYIGNFVMEGDIFSTDNYIITGLDKKLSNPQEMEVFISIMKEDIYGNNVGSYTLTELSNAEVSNMLNKHAGSLGKQGFELEWIGKESHDQYYEYIKKVYYDFDRGYLLNKDLRKKFREHFNMVDDKTNNYNYQISMEYSVDFESIQYAVTQQNLAWIKEGKESRMEFLGEIEYEESGLAYEIAVLGIEEKVSDANEFINILPVFGEHITLSYEVEGFPFSSIYRYFWEIDEEEIIQIYKGLEGKINESYFLFFDEESEEESKEYYSTIKTLYYDKNLEKLLYKGLREDYEENASKYIGLKKR